jgi:hypothetical protein
MSSQIDTALVQKYQNNIEIKFQQSTSRLRSAVRVEMQNAEYAYYDRISATSMSEEVTRHGDTQYVDTPHERRRVGLGKYSTADLIDDKDKLQMLADPTSSYVENAVRAANRKLDELIIAAAFGDVYTGKTGSTTVDFATDGGQVIEENYVESGSPADSDLTIGKLRQARKLLDDAEASEDDLFMVIGPAQRQALLASTEVSSSDFNTVKALVNGEINQFMGFTFIMSNLLPIASDIRSCIAFGRNGLLLAMAKDITARVDELPNKNYSVQTYVTLMAGSTRMWGEKVIEVQCDEAA